MYTYLILSQALSCYFSFCFIYLRHIIIVLPHCSLYVSSRRPHVAGELLCFVSKQNRNYMP